ncbi:hypothetical protein A2U01_0051162, partial [Trifolium medium]|nr:hypothetical protein [Trifolium medium]
MNRSSAWNDSRTHYSLHQAASDDGFFKLNSMKSWNDTDIEIDPANCETSISASDETNLVKAISEPIERQIEG